MLFEIMMARIIVSTMIVVAAVSIMLVNTIIFAMLVARMLTPGEMGTWAD